MADAIATLVVIGGIIFLISLFLLGIVVFAQWTDRADKAQARKAEEWKLQKKERELQLKERELALEYQRKRHQEEEQEQEEIPPYEGGYGRGEKLPPPSMKRKEGV